MARKTQNSSQTLPSAIARTLQSSETPLPRTSGRKLKTGSHVPANATAYNAQHQKASDGEDGSVDSQHSTDDAKETDKAEDQPGKPAVNAPSVRPSIEGSEQAGLVMSQDINQKLAVSDIHVDEVIGDLSDDDDYAAVNDISDSSDDEPDVEINTDRIVLRGKDAHPTTNHLRWYQHEQKIQGRLGENESFFDQHHWDDLESTSSASDNFDYHTAWDGLPDTPLEPQTPMSLPSPSSRRVHFESKTSSHSLDNPQSNVDISDNDLAASDPAAAQPSVEKDDNGNESGYETEGETTDEEEPPVSAKVLVKAPYLLLHSPPPSISPGTANHSRRPSSEKGFKVPAMPASRRPYGPKLGTFKNSPSRSYTMFDETGRDLIVYEAARPSPRPPLGGYRIRPGMSNSAPATPSISHATLSLPPDLSDTEFSDALGSQMSADPVLSVGPDFIASAGFSQTSSHIPRAVIPPQQTSELYPQDNFDPSSFLSRQANGAEAQFDDLDEEEIGEDAFESFIKWGESSSDDEDSVTSSSSRVSGTLAVGATSPSAQAAPRNSPSSVSSNHDPFGVDVAAWRNSPNQRHQPRHPPKRAPHGLSLSGMGKKRKIGEVHGRKTPPMPISKRRLPATSR